MALLEGVKILDLSRVLAGPFATMYLSDLGAEVIKIEPPEGDETRRYTPIVNGVSTYYYSVNRGKEVIFLDLKDDGDRTVLKKYIEESDILIHNYRMDTARRLGVTYRDVLEVNPKIIYASIKGFDGEEGRFPAYDLIIQARSGIMMATGYEESPPVRVGFALADIFAGLYLATGILSALYGGSRPCEIEVFLYDSLLYSMTYLTTSYLIAGVEPGRHGSGHPSIVPYQAFQCRDGGYVAIAAPNNKFFNLLCRALGLEELLSDERFIDNPSRVRYRDDLIKVLSDRIRELDTEEILDRLGRLGVPHSKVNTVGEALRESYVCDAGILGLVHDIELGAIKMVKPPIKIDGERPFKGSPPIEGRR